MNISHLPSTPPPARKKKNPCLEEITLNIYLIKEQLEDRQIIMVILVALHVQLELSEEVVHCDVGAVLPWCCSVLQWGIHVRVLLSNLKYQVQQLVLSCATVRTNLGSECQTPSSST